MALISQYLSEFLIARTHPGPSLSLAYTEFYLVF